MSLERMAVFIVLLSIIELAVAHQQDDELDIDVLFGKLARISGRQMTLQRCRPDLFPDLRDSGFCVDVNDLDDICFTLEVSQSRNCSDLGTQFCCYRSIFQGNALVTTTTRPGQTTTRLTTTTVTSPSSTIITTSPTGQQTTPTITSTAPTSPSTTTTSTTTEAATISTTTAVISTTTGASAPTSTSIPTTTTTPVLISTPGSTAPLVTGSSSTTTITSTTTPQVVTTSAGTTGQTASTATSTTTVSSPNSVTTSSTTAAPTTTTTTTTTATTTTRTTPTTTTPSTTTTRTTPTTTTTTTTPTTTTSTTTRTTPTTTTPSTTTTSTTIPTTITTTPTTTTTSASAPSGSTDIDTTSPAIQQAILAFHNRLRRAVSRPGFRGLNNAPQPPATNMRELVWSDALRRAAQFWANQCQGGHSPENIRQEPGENLASATAASAASNLTAFLSQWEDEARAFNYHRRDEEPGCAAIRSADVGHWTQVVWAETTQVGCGYSRCPLSAPRGARGNFFVCQYETGGNANKCAPYDIDGQVCRPCGGRNDPRCRDNICATPPL